MATISLAHSVKWLHCTDPAEGLNPWPRQHPGGDGIDEGRGRAIPFELMSMYLAQGYISSKWLNATLVCWINSYACSAGWSMIRLMWSLCHGVSDGTVLMPNELIMLRVSPVIVDSTDGPTALTHYIGSLEELQGVDAGIIAHVLPPCLFLRQPRSQPSHWTQKNPHNWIWQSLLASHNTVNQPHRDITFYLFPWHQIELPGLAPIHVCSLLLWMQ